ncbi:MAG TPA: lytic transglycosylase domain-containing protein [Longimicrobiaceae bacterium]|nr:lytic transglycosylase domain-containing protein [Longimicrobiaceae bacterium]
MVDSTDLTGARWLLRRLAGAAAVGGLLATGTVTHAGPVAPAPLMAAEMTVVVDTVPSSPLHFRRVGLLETEYLDRVVEAAQKMKGSNASAQVTQFARRYDIPEDLARTIRDIASAEGIDPELAFRLVYTESRFNPRARGPAGALGLMQLMPSTARWLDRSLRTEAQILEPKANLRAGFGYLYDLIRRYEGDVRLGLLAYNRGEGTVNRALRNGRDPENGYSRKVLGTGENRYEGDGLITSRR